MGPPRDSKPVKLPVDMRGLETKPVKLAVKMGSVETKPDTNPVAFLGEFSLQDPLAAFIAELCLHWKVDHPEQYALQYSEPPPYYVTEKNKSKIKDGIVLYLVFSPGKTADDILQKLNIRKSIDEKKEALEKLCQMSGDVTFANEFIKRRGMDYLIECLEGSKPESPLLPLILTSFLELMDHGIINWDELQPTFIERVASYVNSQTPVDNKTLNSALTILENIVTNSQLKSASVEKQITIPKLLNHISNCRKSETQQAVLALINALIQTSDPQKKKHWCSSLTSKQYRTILSNNIVLHLNEYTLGSSDLAHQLYVLQQLLLNQYEERMNTSMEANYQDANDKIKELWKTAFEPDGEVSSGITPRKPENKKDYKKLGFKNEINPPQDFKDTPPGMLALDNMIYFARHHSGQYATFVLENCYRDNSHECPFGRASIELTKLLCTILKIGEVPSDQDQSFHPMFFSNDYVFEELFSICIVILNKTWKEMKATTEDFSKVSSVVNEQIKRSLSKRPLTLEDFRKEINNLNYVEIAEIWRQERLNHEEQEMQAPPIKELRRSLLPDILDLIEQQRLRFMEEGTRFKIVGKSRNKYRYCQLSPNHKFLHYDECDEKHTPSLDELGKKVSIVDIKSVLAGKDLLIVKERSGRKNLNHLSFSVTLDSAGVGETSHLDFVALDEKSYNYWVDGLHALLRQSMPSPQTTADLEILLNMEIKLRLLDAEGISIPSTQPPIPLPPPNYSFCYQLP